MNILVTDGETRASLAAVRSLGAGGHRIGVAVPAAGGIASASRSCHRKFIVPPPEESPIRYVEAVADAARSFRADRILPVTDASVLLLSGAQGVLPEKCLLLAPAPEALARVQDKAFLVELAAKTGVPYPATVPVSHPGEVERLGHLPFGFPVVVKPARSRIPCGDRILRARVRYARSTEELRRLYRETEELAFPSLIQERVTGPGTGFFTLFDGNRHRAVFCHRRLREKPPSGGVSVLCESIPPDPEMADGAERLLRAAGWNGIAMVEFKRDQRTGRAVLMEINGRFWGSLQLAIDCGVDFPALLLGQGRREAWETPAGRYSCGRRLRWFLGDLDHLLMRFRKPADAMDLPADAPSRAFLLRDFLVGSPLRTRWDVFRWNDPAPFLAECREYLRSASKSPSRPGFREAA